MNQQAKDGLCQLLERRSKKKVETKDMEIAPDVTTKSCLVGGRQGRLPRNCSKKRERFSTVVVEYEEKEVRDLLALERPKKKLLEHYARKCPERNNKLSKQAKRNRPCHLSEMQQKGTLCK
jgi:hypothetical protein